MRFFPRMGAGRAISPAQQTPSFVDVTPTGRERVVADRDSASPIPPLDLDRRAARAVVVMRQHSAFLADRSNTIEPPSREQLVEAYQDAEAFILDRLVTA